MIFFVFLVLAVGTLIFGRRFLGDVWRIIRYGGPEIRDAVVANRVFRFFMGAITLAIALPILGVMVGLFFAHRHRIFFDYITVGPNAGRAVIVLTFLMSFFIIGTIWGLSDLSIRVALFANPSRNVENLRKGWRYFCLSGLFVEALSLAVLFTVGIYASIFLNVIGLIGVLLLWITGEVYDVHTRFLLWAGMTLGGLCVLWYFGGSVPPSAWLWATGHDYSSLFQPHSAVDNLDAIEAREEAMRAEREACSQEIQRISGELRAARTAPRVGNFQTRLKRIRDLSEELGRVERQCAERTGAKQFYGDSRTSP